jgi:putative membrane protein
MDSPVAGETGTMSGDASMPMTAQAFADAAAASDTFELESSRLAQKMGKSAAVKDFAAMMIKDHAKSTADLKAAASKASPAVTPAPKMTAEQQSDLDALKAATGNFDQVYAQKQVAAHEKALAMLQGYASGGDAASLKDFASKTAPVVSGHLDKARSLSK